MSWQTGNPPKSGYYLVTYTRWITEHQPAARTVAESRFDGKKWWDMIWAGSSARELTGILAWQPLPEPYRPVETREAPPLTPTQAPWPNLVDGYTPPGIDYLDPHLGRILLARDPGQAWDGWLLSWNEANAGWSVLRQASQGDIDTAHAYGGPG